MRGVLSGRTGKIEQSASSFKSIARAMLDPKVAAYLREHPDVLSRVIERLLKDQDASELFGATSKRFVLIRKEYDRLGRPVPTPGVVTPTDYWHDVLVGDMRGEIEDLVINTVLDDESAFLDLFMLALVCKSLRADLMGKVMSLEMRFDVVPHYCRAAFLHYDDLETFKLFLDRLDSCAPAAVLAWKCLLADEDREGKFVKLRRLMQEKMPEHFDFALLNNAQDPIAATICLHFMAGDASPFSSSEIDFLFTLTTDLDLAYVMQPLRDGRVLGMVKSVVNSMYPVPLTRAKERKFWEIDDHVRFFYYCARRYELAVDYGNDNTDDIQAFLNDSLRHMGTSLSKNERDNSFGRPLMLKRAFKVLNRFFGSRYIVNVISLLFWRHQWGHNAIPQLVASWLDSIPATGSTAIQIAYDAAATIGPHLGHVISMGTLERLMRPTMDFEFVKAQLDRVTDIHQLARHYEQATVQQNVAVLLYLRSNNRLEARRFLDSCLEIAMSNPGTDGGAAQLRVVEALVPDGFNDLDFFQYLKYVPSGQSIAEPLAAKLQELGEKLEINLPAKIRRGIIAFKLSKMKSVTEALALLGLDTALPVEESRSLSIEALKLVLDRHMPREITRAVVAFVARAEHDIDYEGDGIQEGRTFTEGKLFTRVITSVFKRASSKRTLHGMNPHAIWECINISSPLAIAFVEAAVHNINWVLRACSSPLIFMEKIASSRVLIDEYTPIKGYLSAIHDREMPLSFNLNVATRLFRIGHWEERDDGSSVFVRENWVSEKVADKTVDMPMLKKLHHQAEMVHNLEKPS